MPYILGAIALAIIATFFLIGRARKRKAARAKAAATPPARPLGPVFAPREPGDDGDDEKYWRRYY